MEGLLVELGKGLASGALGFFASWGLMRVQRKAARTEESFGVSDRWKGWAESLERRVATAERKVERLTRRVSSYETTIAVALDWIDRTLTTLDELGVPHPPLPARLARLLDEKRRGVAPADNWDEDEEVPDGR